MAGLVKPIVVSLILLAFTMSARAQTVALLTPNHTDSSVEFIEIFETHIRGSVKTLDRSLAESAFTAASATTPFNLTTTEAKNIGAAVGCEFFILARAGTQRRSSYLREEYYESFAAIYLVSSRTGRLVFWKLANFEAPKANVSRQMLIDAVPNLAKDVAHAVHSFSQIETNEPERPNIEEIPDENSPAAKNFRAPVPYRRIKPEYTAVASLFDITATVDIVVDIDSDGRIERTEIVRWAGFGLNESVENTVRAMNWRPAERNGKPLPMRVLLRYNFTKIEKK